VHLLIYEETSKIEKEKRKRKRKASPYLLMKKEKKEEARLGDKTPKAVCICKERNHVRTLGIH
jgi:hypothetical protein